jgi:carboxyl-terminal processing protease
MNRFAAIFAVFVLMPVCPLVPARAEERPRVDEDFEMYAVLADTVDQVQRSYVKELSRQEILDAAIQGIVSKLDVHSAYIGPEQLSNFKTSVDLEFVGIGVQIDARNKDLRVIAPMHNSPAQKAGILAGDRIIEIDGALTNGMSIDAATKTLRGAVGSAVKLKVLHPGKSEFDTIEIRREVIPLETVLGDRKIANDQWEFMLLPDQKVGYVRITSFGKETAADLQKALQDLEKRGMKRFVLDLRFNPGGLLTSAIEVCDLFLESGRIVSVQGRNTEERVWDAKGPGTFSGFPMVVLVNHYSASASEIVSAALQDHHRAVIIGERTWGKGSVQNVIDLPGNHSALKLTTAGYLRPSGKNINRAADATEKDEWGVTPDANYVIKLTDPEVAEAARWRAQRDRDAASLGKTNVSPGTFSPDRQLAKAIEYLLSPAAAVKP